MAVKKDSRVPDAKEVISFRYDVLPNTMITLGERIKGDCTVDEIRIRFYQGQQLSLEVYPFIQHKGNMVESFFTYAGGSKQVISGENDYFVFPISIACEENDQVKVRIQNKDAVNTYTASIDVVVDYLGGTARAI